jgi:hypothetical protein
LVFPNRNRNRDPGFPVSSFPVSRYSSSGSGFPVFFYTLLLYIYILDFKQRASAKKKKDRKKGRSMAKPSITNLHLPESFYGSVKISKDVPSQSMTAIKHMFEDVEISGTVPENCNIKDFYSDLIRGHLKPQRVVRGRVTCLLSVTPISL